MAAGTIDQSVVTEVYVLPIIGYMALRTLTLEVIYGLAALMAFKTVVEAGMVEVDQ